MEKETSFIFINRGGNHRKVLTAADDLFRAFDLTNFVCKKRPRNKFAHCLDLKLKKKDFKLKRGSPRFVGLKKLAMHAPPPADLIALRNLVQQFDKEEMRAAFALGSTPLMVKKHK